MKVEFDFGHMLNRHAEEDCSFTAVVGFKIIVLLRAVTRTQKKKKRLY